MLSSRDKVIGWECPCNEERNFEFSFVFYCLQKFAFGDNFWRNRNHRREPFYNLFE